MYPNRRIQNCQTSRMELFAKIVKDIQTTILLKSSILDISQNSENNSSAYNTFGTNINLDFIDHKLGCKAWFPLEF